MNRRYRQEGQSEADFFSCVAFGKVVETFEKCAVGKGTKLLLECEARNNNWTDSEGKKHYDIDFIVNSFEFCESKGGGQIAAVPVPNKNTETNEQPFEGAENVDDEDDLPF